MRIGAAFLLILLTGCITDGAAPSPQVISIPVKDWSKAEQQQMASDEEKYLPQNSILWDALKDYASMRKAARAAGVANGP